MSLSLPSSATLSERGRRPTNEDSALATQLPDGRALVAVADGMGGHAGGEVASALAVRTLEAWLATGVGLPEAVATAHEAIRERARVDRSLRGMGTTVVALLQTGRQYEIVNVGDSRAYRVFPDRVEQITEDHSVLAEALRAGQMTPEAALRSPWRNVVTRSLGAESTPQADSFGPFRADELGPHAVLLCSDGLYRALSVDEIRAALLQRASPEAAARLLVARALAAGSDDNVSVAIRDFGLFSRTSLPDEPGVAADATRNGAARVDLLRPPAAPVVRSRSESRTVNLPRVSDQALFITCAAMLLLWVTILLWDL